MSRPRITGISKSLLLMLVCGLVVGIGCFLVGLIVGGHQPVEVRYGKPLSFYHSHSEEAVVPAPVQNYHGRIPGEFEHQAAIMIGANEMLAYHPRAFVQMVAALHMKVKVMGLIWDEGQRAAAIDLLKADHLPADAVDFYVWPERSMWVRDFGPFFVLEKDGGPAHIVDYRYGEPNRDYGDLFNATFAGTFGYQFIRAELTFEGGNLLTNGDGLAVTSNWIGEENAPRGYGLQQILDQLGANFQFKDWTRVEPLTGEPTHHVDMFCTFCATNQVIVGSYTHDQDATNAEILDKDAAVLAQNSTSKGTMRVARIPMPSHRDGNWRTYTNVIYANGTLLVPQYHGDNEQADKTALAIYRKILPNWEVVGIDCSTLAEKRGALHCISFNIPWMPEDSGD
jgi:agmatine/peptidylarginine deiminase